MLTDTQIRKAKPADKPVKLADGGGLLLFISPSGGKLWRFRYRIDGKEKLLSIGAYPGVSLDDARKAREAAKAALREGRDPSLVKKAERVVAQQSRGTTFETIAREWHDLQKPGWVPRHASDVLKSFENDVFHVIGDYPIASIDGPIILSLLRGIETGKDRREGTGPAKETARRIRQRISAVFVYAISTGRASRDPAAPLKLAMAPLKKGRQPAITTLEGAREIIAKVDAEHAHPTTKLALRLLALTVVRPGTLITTPWTELPEGIEVWQIPAERMKLRLQHKDDERKDHFIPLSTQALETIAALRALNGRYPLVFPNTRHGHKPMSENAIGYLLNRAGYHHRHVPHGWRATFSTVMNEHFPQDRAVIDLMLAHQPDAKVEAAYNRAMHMKRRTELAQTWADMLMEGQMPVDELMTLPRK